MRNGQFVDGGKRIVSAAARPATQFNVAVAGLLDHLPCMLVQQWALTRRRLLGAAEDETCAGGPARGPFVLDSQLAKSARRPCSPLFCGRRIRWRSWRDRGRRHREGCRGSYGCFGCLP